MSRYLFKGLFFFILARIAQEDRKNRTIQNGLLIAFAVTAVLYGFFCRKNSMVFSLAGSLCVSLPMRLCIFILPGSFGMGDVKLMAAAGWLLGWKRTLLAFSIGTMSGGLYSVCLLAAGKKRGKQQIAFGSFLCLGIWCCILAGNRISACF